MAAARGEVGHAAIFEADEPMSGSRRYPLIRCPSAVYSIRVKLQAMAPPRARPSFEELYQQLEEKVTRLEQGGLSLDDSLTTYEEAVALAQRCQQLLDGAELRITRLKESLAVTDEARYRADVADDIEEEEGS